MQRKVEGERQRCAIKDIHDFCDCVQYLRTFMIFVIVFIHSKEIEEVVKVRIDHGGFLLMRA